MAAHASRTSVDTVDSVGNASGSIFDSLRQGASDLQVSAGEALPATGRFLGRVFYNASYAVSFGVTFPVMMIVRIVPKENAMVHGLVDGALAARDRVHDWGGEMMAMEEDHHEADAEEADSHASGNGTGHPAASAHKTQRRPRAKKSTTGARKTTRSSSKKKS